MAFCDLFSGAQTAARLTHLIMITIRTTARPTGVPGTLPAPRCSMSAALQAHSPADDTHSSIPLLQKMLPCRRHTHPPASCRDPAAGPGILATFETRSLSTSLKKVPAGAQEHCIALRCIVLNFKLHVCNLILEPANTVVDLKM